MSIGSDILDLVQRYGGMPLVADRFVPEGVVYKIGATIVIGPLTLWRWRHDMRDPMISRYSRGMIELERDRRRRGR